MTTENNSDLVSKLEAQEMIDKALRRHNRRSTIIFICHLIYYFS